MTVNEGADKLQAPDRFRKGVDSFLSAESTTPETIAQIYWKLVESSNDIIPRGAAEVRQTHALAGRADNRMTCRSHPTACPEGNQTATGVANDGAICHPGGGPVLQAQAAG